MYICSPRSIERLCSADCSGLQDVGVCVGSLEADPRPGVPRSDVGRDHAELFHGQVHQTHESSQQQRFADVRTVVLSFHEFGGPFPGGSGPMSCWACMSQFSPGCLPVIHIIYHIRNL